MSKEVQEGRNLQIFNFQTLRKIQIKRNKNIFSLIMNNKINNLKIIKITIKISIKII